MKLTCLSCKHCRPNPYLSKKWRICSERNGAIAPMLKICDRYFPRFNQKFAQLQFDKAA